MGMRDLTCSACGEDLTDAEIEYNEGVEDDAYVLCFECDDE